MRVEIRADSVTIDGYVNVPGRESKVLNSASGKFIEKIEPRAFQRALDGNPNTLVLFNHNESRCLGSAKDDHVNLREDNIGLRCTLTTSDAEIMEKARNKELRGWSFGFIATRQAWTDPDDSGIRHRTVQDMELREVSLLDQAPAYLATSVETRDDSLLETRTHELGEVLTVEEERAAEPVDFGNHLKIIETLERG